jgi:hypothetical protein
MSFVEGATVKKNVLRILGVVLLKSKKRTWGHQFLFPLISLLLITFSAFNLLILLLVQGLQYFM